MEEKSPVIEEFEKAQKEGRQPKCIYCGEPLEVVETQGIELKWVWNEKTKKFEKIEGDGWSDKPACANCEVKDWDFTNNGFCEY